MRRAPRPSQLLILTWDDLMVVNDIADSAVNAHHTNNLHTRSINIMLHENEEESRS